MDRKSNLSESLDVSLLQTIQLNGIAIDGIRENEKIPLTLELDSSFSRDDNVAFEGVERYRRYSSSAQNQHDSTSQKSKRNSQASP